MDEMTSRILKKMLDNESKQSKKPKIINVLTGREITEQDMSWDNYAEMCNAFGEG